MIEKKDFLGGLLKLSAAYDIELPASRQTAYWDAVNGMEFTLPMWERAVLTLLREFRPSSWERFPAPVTIRESIRRARADLSATTAQPLRLTEPRPTVEDRRSVREIIHSFMRQCQRPVRESAE